MISRKAVSALLAVALLLLSACATRPAPVSQTETVPAAVQKVRKERTVTVRVPILIKETAFYPDGLVDSYSVYSYDEAQMRLLEKKSFDAARPDPVERIVSQYEGGRLVSNTTYDSDGKVRVKREYGYDASDRLVSERVLDSKGLVQSISAFSYDSDGNKTEWKVLDKDSISKAVTSYSYQNGKLVLIEMKNGSGALTGSIRIEYDAQGREVKRSYLGTDGALQKYEQSVYAEGTNGLPAALETHYPSGALNVRTAYTYGPDGEILAEVDTDSKSAVKETRKYEYRIREDHKTEVYYE